MNLQPTIRDRFLIGLCLAMFFLTLPLICAAQEKIAFTSDRDGNQEIYVMNPDGTNQIRLTNNAADDSAPSFSPDGSQIVFTFSSEIYVMNSDGTNQTRLTNNSANDGLPSFSFDGSRIAFDSDRDGNDEIYVMNADGTNQTRLTFNPANDGLPSFSPDGSRIAFASNRDGNNFEVYVMNADGTNQTRLTNGSAFNSVSSFSPDGTQIVFTSGRDGNFEIYIMNSDGTNQARLTNNSAVDNLASFNFDGSRIAFTSSRDGNREIYVMNSDGTNQTRLTNNSADDSFPSWGGGQPTAPDLINVAATSSVNENGAAVLSGGITDINAGDTFILTVNWGDGSAPQTFNYSAGTASFAETHQYADDDPTATASDDYPVNLSLSDSTNRSDTDSTVVTVNNIAPTLSGIALSPSTIGVSGTTMLSGIVGDVGARDSHVVQINWGDGSPNTTLNLPAAGVSAFSANHQYTNTGNYTIGITASDDDSGATSAGASVVVNTTVPPNAPNGLTATAASTSQINLAWTDNSNNENGFSIERCKNKNCQNFVQIAQVGANIAAFSDTGLFANTQYHYRVRAVNNIGSSAYSNTASAKTFR